MTFMADISERKKVETELKENEDRYRQAIENSPNPIFSVDGSGAIKMWNRACETVFKYEKDIINHHYQKLLSESEDHDAVQAMISNVFQGHSMSDIDLSFKCKDGKERFMVSRLYPVYDSEKQIQGCVFGNTDITERKLAEEALRDSEYRYRMLTQNLPGIVYRIMMREDNHIIFFNDLLQPLTGYKAEELQFGKYCGMEPFILTEDRERVVDIVRSAVEEEAAFEVHYRFMHKNGSVKWFHENGKPVYGDDGKPLYIDGLIFDVTKRKQAEEALEDSKAQKQAILDASVDAIMQLDKDMKIIWANKKAAEMINEVPGNLVGRRCHKIYYDSDEPCKGCFGVQTFQTGVIETGTIAHKGMAGVDEYYWEHFAVPLKDDNGRVYSIIEISRNVTDKVKAENRIKASEERFRQLSESTWEAIAIHDHGILLRANQQFFDMFGYTSEELLNTDMFSMIAAPESVKHIKSQIDSGRLGPYEVMGSKKDGTEFPIVIRVKVMEYYGKNVRVVAIRDISERKKAEEKIRESEKKYRSIFENIQDVYFEVNREGAIREISPSIEKHTAYNREDLIGKSIYDFFNTIEDGKTVVNRIMKGGRAGEFEFELMDKDGTGLQVSMNMMFVKDEKQGAVKIVGTMRDITERKNAEKEKNKLEERLIRSQKMEALGFLAGGVAHDLNNVLSGIVSYPDLLLMDISEDSPLREPILTIQESGQKASMIVQDLLTLARRGVTATEILDMNKIVSDYFRSPEHQKIVYPHNRINIQIDLKADLPHIKGSDVHLKKTVMNLISNAVEAMPDGGEIIVSTENKYVDRPIRGYDHVEEGDYVVLTIKDYGIGISPEDLKRIFEPFYTKKVMGRSGTGLGMAVVWGAVQDHKGYIDVQSLEGKGSTFELYFPITREVIDTEKPVTPIEDYKGQGESILVVDDVREQREIASNILTKLNYSVNAVSSGEEAVEFLRSDSADLVLLDMIMDNGIDGLETYKRILQFRSDQKAIVVSGFSETDRVKDAQKLGAGEYIKKPYTMETIGIAIRRELDRSE
ncbi:MAG: PAS domain S-box protein [Deltaproteobacteria bacterium]|nr:PAS domain S-box protein [Deltaproteobacteria bacterium]